MLIDRRSLTEATFFSVNVDRVESCIESGLSTLSHRLQTSGQTGYSILSIAHQHTCWPVCLVMLPVMALAARPFLAGALETNQRSKQAAVHNADGASAGI